MVRPPAASGKARGDSAATLEQCPQWTSLPRPCARGRAGSSRPTRSARRRSTATSPRWKRSPTRSCARRPTALRERARNGESLDDLLPEAFALTREASRRTTGQRHYDVQLIGGMVLHDGAIAEMRTGEGKTLTATLPVFLNTLAGDSVHVVTVNDYLARRDSEWMKPIYEALGVSVAARPGRRRPRRPGSANTPATSPTGPTPSSASTTCATTCRSRSSTASSAATTSRSWTRSTTS